MHCKNFRAGENWNSSNCANYLATRFKGLITLGACEALLMVCIAHGGDDFAFDVVLTNGTFGSECFLVVGNTIIVGVFWKESPNCQWFITLDALKASFVEVFVSDTQYLAGTLFLAFSTVDFCFTCETNKFYLVFFTQIFKLNSRTAGKEWRAWNNKSNQLSSSELSGYVVFETPKKPQYNEHNSSSLLRLSKVWSDVFNSIFRLVCCSFIFFLFFSFGVNVALSKMLFFPNYKTAFIISFDDDHVHFYIFISTQPPCLINSIWENYSNSC